MSSLVDRILTKVRDDIRSMGLPGLDNRSVQIRRAPWTKTEIYRGVTVHQTEDRLGAGTNGSDDIGYGIGVTIITGNPDTTAVIGRVAGWRDSITTRFLNKTLPGIPEVYVCKVRLGDVYLPRQFQASNDATQVIVRPWVEKHRS